MILSEIRDLTKLRLNELGANNFFTDAQLNTYINRGLNILSDVVPVRDEDISFSISTGQYIYDINAVEIISVVISNRHLKRVYSFSTPGRYKIAGYSSGTEPNYYMYNNGKLYIYPTPETDTNASIIYSRIATALSLDSDEPEVAEKYHFLLIHYATYLALSQIVSTALNNDGDNYSQLYKNELNIFNEELERKTK